MSEKGSTESGLERALEGYARLITEQNAQTNKKIETLTNSVQTLVETSIKSEERHKQIDERNERFESNQRTQGKKIEHLSDCCLTMAKDLERNADRWGGLYKVLSGVLTTIVGAAVVAVYINK